MKNTIEQFFNDFTKLCEDMAFVKGHLLELEKNVDLKPEVDQLLSIQQAAEILRLSVPTIYGFVSRSEIPCMKKGKRLYFLKAELISWVKTGRKMTISEIENEADRYLSNRKRKYK